MLYIMNDCNIKLEQVYENKFNKIILSIVDFISTICISYNIPKNFIHNNKNKIKEFINTDKQEPIAYFLKYIYEDDVIRYKIKTMDDTFYNKFVKHTSLLKNWKGYYINNMYNFSTIWGKIDTEYKNIIKRSMSSLIIICEKYIEILYNNRVKKNNFISEYSIDSISMGSD